MADPTDADRAFSRALWAGEKPEPETLTDEELETVTGLFSHATETAPAGPSTADRKKTGNIVPREGATTPTPPADDGALAATRALFGGPI